MFVGYQVTVLTRASDQTRRGTGRYEMANAWLQYIFMEEIDVHAPGSIGQAYTCLIVDVQERIILPQVGLTL